MAYLQPMKEQGFQPIEQGPPPTVTELARLWETSDTTVYNLIYRGKLKVLTGFGRLRVPWSEIERLKTEATVYVPRKRPGTGRTGKNGKRKAPAKV
jgi:hypothetical protein